MDKLKETRMQKFKALRDKLKDEGLKHKSDIFNSLFEPFEHLKKEVEEVVEDDKTNI